MRHVSKKQWAELSSEETGGNRKFSAFCHTMFSFTFLAHILFMPIFYMLGNPVVLINNILAVIIDFFCLRLNRAGRTRLAGIIWTIEIVAHSTGCIIVYGWDQGYYFYLLALVPIVFFSGFSGILRLMLTSTLFSVALLLFYTSEIFPPITETNTAMTHFMYLSNVLASFTGLSYASFYYLRYSEQLEHRLIHLAHTDSLTGISNRGFFEGSVQAELQWHQDNGYPCAFILFDIDDFKGMNDSYGHAMGDLALKQVTDMSRSVLRKGDLIGRLGGEEFGVFLPNTDQNEAKQVAERIRRKIYDSTFQTSRGIGAHLSISLGLTIPRTDYVALPELMRRADRAMYQAKRNGGNRAALFL
ncbi:GGDEF domain-containing protein [Sporolactobacillus sp. Y61]|uniref:GGDEF domain-containing protein n=1 Tax=Sporolactobacillus sp. Y61 TaxID=3160863 RepID=A0AAU8IFT2_9BACL|nr:GGDEF domain-containing protein [Sporolactobacillus sp. THM19-2]